MLRGFELACEHINAQHAHVGPQISFMIEDDKSSVEGAIEVFVGWVKRVTPIVHQTQLTVPNIQRTRLVKIVKRNPTLFPYSDPVRINSTHSYDQKALGYALRVFHRSSYRN